MQPLKVVLVDDHPILRQGLAALMDVRPELQIVGQCGDGLSAVEMIQSLTPDFAIIDLELPKLHGLEVIQRLRQIDSPTKLIVLSISHDENRVRWALRAGANGYVVKDGPANDLFEAISRIRNGRVYVSPSLQEDETASKLPFHYPLDDPEEGGTPGEGCAGVTAPLLPRRPFRPPMAVKLPLPEEEGSR